MHDPSNDVRLTDAELGILAALSRPRPVGNRSATQSTDQLRTLYRKFGIEDLPDDQKRARLIELAIDGGYVSGADAAPTVGEPASVPLGSASILVAEEEREARERRAEKKSGRPLTPYVTAVILILVVIGGTLSISGIFNQGSTSAPPPTPAAFRAEVSGYCKQALAGVSATTGEGRAERARGYLEVIETIRDPLFTLVPPSTPSVALERFGAGLTNAANYTSDVADEPPAAGSAAEAKDVAELTSAAAQVRAGAAGYGLGHACLAIGDVVAASAQNAAAS